MAFGNEMDDFLKAFQVGYSMFKSKDEKEWEKEKKQMERERHAWGKEDRDYRRSRDGVMDDFRNRQFDRGVLESDRNYEFQVDQSGRSQGRWEVEQEKRDREFKLRENQLKLERAKERGAIPDITPSRPNPHSLDEDAAVDGGTTGSVQQSEVGLANTPRVASATAPSSGGATGGGQQLARSSASPTYSPLQYANSGATRNKPLSNELAGALEKVLPKLGVTARVFSGGQDAKGKGGRRTGSTRHDYGNAADVFFYKDGRKLDWSDPKDRPIFEAIVREGRKVGITGFGAGDGYMQRGSMHLGFGKPAVWGRGGSKETAPDWLKTAYYGSSQGMARGGLVAAIPEDDEEEIYAPAGNGSVEIVDASADDPVLPEDGPIPSPRYEGGMQGNQEEPTNDRWEAARRSVRDGLNKAASDAGFDVDAAIDDPELEDLRQKYIRGYGATPAGVMRQVMDKIDPDKKMPASERNMMALAEVYQFYTERGELDKAQDAAASMVQYYRRSFQQFAALARAAIEGGDLDKAQKAAIAAYANIPNGRDLSIEKLRDGKYEVRVTDMETGKEVTNQVMDPREFGAIAMGFGIDTFENELFAAAGIKDPERDNASLSDLSNVQAGVKDYIESSDAPVGNLNAAQLRQFTKIATDIGSDKENQLTGEGAAEFTSRLLQFNLDDLRDGQGPFEVRELRGGKVVEVLDKMTGEIVRMTPNAIRNLQSMRSHLQSKRTEQADKQEASAAWRKGIADDIRKFTGALRDNMAGSNQSRAGDYVGSLAGEAPAPQERAIPEDTASDDPRVIEIQVEIRNLLNHGVPENDPRITALVDELAALGAEP